MMGQICAVFGGQTMDSCLDMTEDQARNWFYESERQEARKRLLDIQNIVATQDGDAYKELTNRLYVIANQPDPEMDGDMDGFDIQRLRMFFGDSARMI